MSIAELIKKLEGLTGHDREVDAAIYRSVAGNSTDHWYTFAGEHFTDMTCPAVTASLDVAMALAVKLLDNGSVDIEVAHRSLLGGTVYGRAEICGPNVYGKATGKTPAIALVLAILRALPSGEQP